MVCYLAKCLDFIIQWSIYLDRKLCSLSLCMDLYGHNCLLHTGFVLYLSLVILTWPLNRQLLTYWEFSAALMYWDLWVKAPCCLTSQRLYNQVCRDGSVVKSTPTLFPFSYSAIGSGNKNAAMSIDLDITEQSNLVSWFGSIKEVDHIHA